MDTATLARCPDPGIKNKVRLKDSQTGGSIGGGVIFELLSGLRVRRFWSKLKCNWVVL